MEAVDKIGRIRRLKFCSRKVIVEVVEGTIVGTGEVYSSEEIL